jgi:uncharacterized protein (TIGR03437 family)
VKYVWRGAPFFLLGVVLYAQAPVITPDEIVNGASFAKGQAITPGSIVSVKGTNLASALAQAGSIPLSTALGDVQSVTFNNVPAPLFFVSPSQINAQVPWEAASSGSASVVVNRSAGSSAPATAALGEFSPGIFSVEFGVGQAIAFFADGVLAAAVDSIPGLTTRPARAGDTVIILATGLGAVDSPAQSGRPPAILTRTTTVPVVLIGGVQAQVAFAGLSPEFPGVNQINVVVPQGVTPGDKVPLQLQAGGITSTDKVTIAISQ